jgi:DsbC/DsbD-like thiol-disulfide interchange protein
MLAGLAGLPLLAAASRGETPKPYRATLVGGIPDGAKWNAGVRVDLDDGWKTYWRNPGDAGIPPSFDWQGSENIADVTVQFPLPKRHTDASGEAIGYFTQVVFPLVATLKDTAKPATLNLAMFFGVCKEVCIPANFEARLQLGGSTPDEDSRQLLILWQQKVPQPAEIVTAASYDSDNHGPLLLLDLKQPVDDILIESDKGAYFRAPEFTSANAARIPVRNIKNIDSLRGTDLRLTFDVGGVGLEQILRLP